MHPYSNLFHKLSKDLKMPDQCSRMLTFMGYVQSEPCNWNKSLVYSTFYLHFLFTATELLASPSPTVTSLPYYYSASYIQAIFTRHLAPKDFSNHLPIPRHGFKKVPNFYCFSAKPFRCLLESCL